MALFDVIARSSRAALWLSALLRYSTHGENPHRAKIAWAYFSFRLKLIFSRHQPTAVRLLGETVRFSGNARDFDYLFWEIFIEETYRGNDVAPETVIDCGSNIGMSILFFKSLWPDCHIIGIEPSPAAFTHLEQNVGQIRGVELLNKAINDRPGRISFYPHGNALMSSTTAMRGDGGFTLTVEATRLSDLINSKIDVLKLDIEGAEDLALAELQEAGKMGLVQYMYIEYHHNLDAGHAGLASFLRRLENCGFTYDLAAKLPRRNGAFQDILIRAKRQH